MPNKCEDCRFWKVWNKKEGYGACRRNPPMDTLDSIPGMNRLEPVWPDTNFDNWCGEFKPKESEER